MRSPGKWAIWIIHPKTHGGIDILFRGHAFLKRIKGFIDEATAAFLRGDDDTYFEALDSVDALLMCLLHDDDEEDDDDQQ